jgi:hypothetical protein
MRAVTTASACYRCSVCCSTSEFPARLITDNISSRTCAQSQLTKERLQPVRDSMFGYQFKFTTEPSMPALQSVARCNMHSDMTFRVHEAS